MSECAAGCAVRGQHLAECDGWAWSTDSCGEPVEVECRGCLPRRAEQGLLCAGCWGRLQSVVRTLPSLVEHLFDMGVPALRCPLGKTGGGGRSAAGSSSLYSDALVFADDLHAVLATYAQEVAVEHPMAGTLPVGLCRWSEGLPVAGPADWADVADGVADPVVLGPREPEDTRRLVAWLSPHLEWVAAQSWSADMLGDLAPLAARARARWPMEEPERRVTDVRCPACGALSLVVRPVRVVGGQSQVVCSRLECGVVLAEEDWARARSWAVAVATGEGAA